MASAHASLPPPDLPQIFTKEMLDTLCELGRIRMVRLAEGNIVPSAEIRLMEADGVLYHFQAEIDVKMKAKVTESRMEGRIVKGREVSTRSDASKTIVAMEGAQAGDVNIHKTLIALIQKEAHWGFGLGKDKFFVLPETRTEFSMTEKCPECSGAGQRPCVHCLGHGQVACPSCQGQGRQICPQCRGARTFTSGDGAVSPCRQCNGQGHLVCAMCHGNSSVTCSKCGSTKLEPCTACAHTGWHSVVFEVMMEGYMHFTADLKKLPEAVVKAILKMGYPALVTEKEADVVFVGDAEAGKPLRALYDVTLPVVAARYTLNNKESLVMMMGKNSRVIECEFFLDPGIKPGINALLKISKGPLAAQTLFATACKYRILRETLIDLAHFSRNNTYHRLLKNYPFGISEKYAKAAVKYADLALKKLSVVPRIKGAALGAITAAVFYRLWFDGAIYVPLHGFIPPYAGYALDGLIVLGGFGAAFYMVKVMAAKALRRILPPQPQNTPRGLPAAGEWGVWASFGAFALLVLVLESLRQVPFWYLLLKSKLPF